MKALTVYKVLSGKGRRATLHACWAGETVWTLCGVKLPEGAVPSHERQPSCRACVSEWRRARRAELERLTPGNTHRVPLYRLHPPTVEPVELPADWSAQPLDLAADTPAARGWQAALTALRALDPAPVCAGAHWQAALTELAAHLTLTPGGFYAEVDRAHYRVLAPLVGALRAAVLAAGLHGGVYLAPRPTGPAVSAGGATVGDGDDGDDRDVTVGDVTQQAAPECGNRAAGASASALTGSAGADVTASCAGASAAAPATRGAHVGAAHPDLQPANHRLLAGEVQKEKWRLVREQGLDQKAAYTEAVARLAGALVPPVAPATLRRFISDTRSYKAPTTSANYVGAPAAGAPAGAVAEAAGDLPTADAPGRVSVLELTRTWLAAHAWLPKAAALAHFSGYTPGRFDEARRTLAAEGWTFSDAGQVWQAQRPKTAEELELERVAAELAELGARQAALLARRAELAARVPGAG